MSEFKYEITERIGVLSESENGWKKSINKVSWNDRPAKFDIREWSPDESRMAKGLTFTDQEMEVLKGLLVSNL